MNYISVIIAVYNTEKYLNRCLDSLMNQTDNRFEIVIVDDCSTDQSREIIKAYREKYKEKIVSIFLERNRGQGFAQNRGLEKASGNYIFLLDSDDYIHEQTIELLLKKSEEYPFDLICFDMAKVINGEVSIQKLNYKADIEGELTPRKRKILMNSSGLYTTRAYRKEFLLKNKIKFEEGIHFGDSVFNSLTKLCAKTISKIDKTLYFYDMREGSSSNAYNQERMYDRIYSCDRFICEAKKRELDNQQAWLVEGKYLKMTVGNIHLCLDMFNPVELEKLKWISNNLREAYPNYKELEAYKQLDRMSKLYLYLNDMAPRWLLRFDKLYKGSLKLLKS